MTTIAMEWPDTRRPEKWTVQRAGTRGHWLPGWFAFSPAYMDQAAWFANHDEALAFAINRAITTAREQAHADSLARWGIALEPLQLQRGKRLPAELKDELERLYMAGASTADLAARYKVTTQTVRNTLNQRGHHLPRGHRHARAN